MIWSTDEIKNRKREKVNQTKFGSLKKVNKVDKPLEILTKIKIGKTQVINIRNERGNITIVLQPLRKIILQIYVHTFSNLEEK